MWRKASNATRKNWKKQAKHGIIFLKILRITMTLQPQPLSGRPENLTRIQETESGGSAAAPEAQLPDVNQEKEFLPELRVAPAEQAENASFTAAEQVRQQMVQGEIAPHLKAAETRLSQASNDEVRIQELMGVAKEHGVAEAEKLAERTQSAHVIDEVHDRLINESSKGGQ
jgi:hypothetical protein